MFTEWLRRPQLTNETKELEFIVRVRVPTTFSKADATRELNYLIDEGTGWFYSSGEAVKVTDIKSRPKPHQAGPPT